MKAANAARPLPGDADAERATAPPGAARDELGAFLAAAAVMLRETVLRFEESVGRITETVVTRSRGVDRELIVSLQDFDRLQQEFTALGDVLSHLAATSDLRAGGVWPGQHGYQAVAAISVAELKARSLRQLQGAGAPSAPADPADDVVF
jgi:hypothetical protein